VSEISPGAEDAAREIVSQIVASSGVFTQADFFGLVAGGAMDATGLPMDLCLEIAAGLGGWLESKGYVALRDCESPDPDCDCPSHRTEVVVTDKGRVWAGDYTLPPWASSDPNYN
jgi:hypothetical protein